MASFNPSRQSINWLFLEGVAIVISILLAFWIDAWWGERQQRDDERVVLQSLLDDLRQKKVTLAADRRHREAVLESTTKLLRAATDADHRLSNDEIDSLIGGISWYEGESAWESAPLNSLMMGGSSSLVSNVMLLQKLSSLHVSITRLRYDYRNEERFHHNILIPYLIYNANLAQINMSIEHEPGDPEMRYFFPEIKISTPRNHSELLSRAEFQSLLAAKIDLYGDLFRPGYLSVEEPLDEAIALLEVELTR